MKQSLKSVLNGISVGISVGIIFSLLWGVLAGVLSGMIAGIAWAVITGNFLDAQNRKAGRPKQELSKDVVLVYDGGAHHLNEIEAGLVPENFEKGEKE